MKPGHTLTGGMLPPLPLLIKLKCNFQYTPKSNRRGVLCTGEPAAPTYNKTLRGFRSVSWARASELTGSRTLRQFGVIPYACKLAVRLDS